MELRVALAQLAVTEDVESNVAGILRGVEFAAGEGAGVLLTPEGSLSGYTPRFDAPTVLAALDRVTAAARDARVGLALGTCFTEPDDGLCYNQVRFYTADGDYLGFHPKTLRCGSLDDPPQGEINHYGVRPLRTYELGGIRVGALICNDIWANPGCTPMDDPHLTQQLSRLGARVVFCAVNGGRDGSEGSEVAWRYHESNLRMRAQAGGIWVAVVDSAYPTHLQCSCPTGVLNPDGRWVCAAEPMGEQFVAHTIELTDC